jgi:hypothetical protein
MAKSLAKTQTVEKPKSKIQLKYEQLLKDIELRKAHQENLEKGMRIVMPKIDSELRPLHKSRNAIHKERIIRLDAVAVELGVGKLNKEWFDPFMASEIEDLLSELGSKDPELLALYQKYEGEEYDNSEEQEHIIAMMKDALGIDVDMDELNEKGAEAYMEEHKEKIIENLREKEERAGADEPNNPSSKTSAKESKKAEEQKLLAQDAKAIYMRLIKKFHPDLQQDEAIKEEYTAISAKITAAYQENDFLGLLKLQIEYLEAGENDASTLADDMLKRYNKLLQKQLAEMEYQLEGLKYNSMGIFEDFFDKNHKFSTAKYNRYKKKIEQEISEIEEDIAASYKRKKGWFKDWMAIIKKTQQQAMYNDILFSMFNL